MPKKAKKCEDKISNDVPCIYTSIPKEFLTSYHNPNKKHHEIDVPLLVLLVLVKPRL